MHITADDLLDALRGQGNRITNSRRGVCEVIAQSHDDHLDAGKILEQVRAQGYAADQSTVYRTLEALEAAGVLHHGHLGHSAAVYHLSDESAHQHLVCDNCGTTMTLDAGVLSAWAASIEASTGFVVDPNHFALTGHCANCAEAGDKHNAAG